MSEETNFNKEEESNDFGRISSNADGISKREKRPRVVRPATVTKTDKIEDGLAFTSNRGFNDVRRDETITQSLIIDLWHRKHYVDRYSVGDENGRRERIDPASIKDILLLSLKHLLYYSAVVPNFAFVNHGNSTPYRVVIQYEEDGIILNVPIEVHFIDFFRYEVNIITAQRINGFKIQDGQYTLAIIGQYESALKRLMRGKLEEIHYCNT